MVTSPRVAATPPYTSDRGVPVSVTRQRLAERFADWRYTGGKRDLRIDFLRGFAVLAMVADHLGGEPSWLYNVTGGNHFLFSAAEGFVFISGFVMGIVYVGVIAKQGVSEASWKALRRAGTLYLLTVILTFAFSALSHITHMPWVEGASVGDPLARMIERLTLHRAFYLTDVLLMYTLLVAAAPFAFVLLKYRRTPVLLVGSWVMWAIYQRWPDQIDLPWKIEDNSVFHVAAWQALFFTGLALGFHREKIAAFARRIPVVPYFAVLTALCTALVVFQRINGSLLAPFTPDSDTADLIDRFFGKADLRIGRVLAFAIFFQFFLTLVTLAWKPLYSALGWFLMPLGQSALLAYSAHLGVIIAFTKIVPQVPFLHTTSAAANTFVQLCGILAVWGVVRMTPTAKTVVRQVREGMPIPARFRLASTQAVQVAPMAAGRETERQGR